MGAAAGAAARALPAAGRAPPSPDPREPGPGGPAVLWQPPGAAREMRAGAVAKAAARAGQRTAGPGLGLRPEPASIGAGAEEGEGGCPVAETENEKNWVFFWERSKCERALIVTAKSLSRAAVGLDL